MRNFYSVSVLVILFSCFGCRSIPICKNVTEYSISKIEKKLEIWELEAATLELGNIKKESTRQKYEKIILQKQKQNIEINLIVDEIKTNMQNNNIIELEKHINKKLFSELKFNEIKKYDLSNCDIFVGKPILLKDKGIVAIGINYQEETYYLEVVLKIIKNKWKIIDFYEKE